MTQRSIVSLLCLAAGLYLILVAAGFLPSQDTKANAPNSIIALTGLVFIVAGGMAFMGRQSRVNELFAAILLLLFGAIGAWVSLFSSSEGFSGGIPFLAYESNVTLGRIVFGVGALMCFALSIWAFRRFARYPKQDEL